jgi:hypothetical protein
MAGPRGFEDPRVGKSSPLGLFGCVGCGGCAGIFALMFFGPMLLIAIIGVADAMKARDSESWPQTKGTVVASKVSKHTSRSRDSKGRSSTSTTYGADVSYKYTVGGEAYTSERISYGDFHGSREGAESLTKKYNVGREVTVYYNPEDAAQSVLEPGTSAGTFLPLLIVGAGLMLPLVAVFLIIFRLKTLKIPVEEDTSAV